jgi:hypothetical protein
MEEALYMLSIDQITASVAVAKSAGLRYVKADIPG